MTWCDGFVLRRTRATMPRCAAFNLANEASVRILPHSVRRTAHTWRLPRASGHLNSETTAERSSKTMNRLFRLCGTM